LIYYLLSFFYYPVSFFVNAWTSVEVENGPM
jgi:hypothetical protein